jgi:3-oxoacyl-[acyl-carrier protein] reductase
MRVNLKGKVALVTGAARGIGEAIANAFAADGALVVYSDIDLETAKAAAAKWPDSLALRLDITNPAEVDAVIEQIVNSCGRLDILVNNAGVNTLQHRVNIDQFPLEEWHRILNVDLTGLFYASRAGARAMLRQKEGRIINIASVFGLVPARVQCAFIAAKAGVVNLTKAMALELGPSGILVNGIAPGSIMTDGTKKLFYGPDGKWNDKVASMLAHVPLARPGTPEEVACAALFLAAPENTYTNGHILVVDGGWTAGYARDF